MIYMLAIVCLSLDDRHIGASRYRGNLPRILYKNKTLPSESSLPLGRFRASYNPLSLTAFVVFIQWHFDSVGSTKTIYAMSFGRFRWTFFWFKVMFLAEIGYWLHPLTLSYDLNRVGVFTVKSLSRKYYIWTAKLRDSSHLDSPHRKMWGIYNQS